MSLPPYAMNRASFPEMYEQMLVGPLFRPWAEWILDEAVGLRAGDRVLDIACGTGIVARVAKERLGTGALVTAVDLSPQMLQVARSLAPEIDWREGDAAAFPLDPDEQFDVVICQQGLQFFPDKAGALRRMYAAAANDARVAVATWRSLEENPIFHQLHAVAERHVGPIVDNRHAFGDDAALASLLRDAGFRDVHVTTPSRTVRFADGSAFLRLNTMALVGMSASSKEMDDAQRAAAVDTIVHDSDEVLKRFTDAGGTAFEIRSNVAIARR